MEFVYRREAAAGWDREAREKPHLTKQAGQGEPPKMPISYLGFLDKHTLYLPMRSDKASFRNIDVKMRSWVVIYGSSSGLYIYYNYTQP